MRPSLPIVVALPLILAACAPFGQMLTQQHALDDCKKLPRLEDQMACRKQTESTYKDYDQKREALTAGAPAQAEDPPKKRGLCFQRATTGETVCPN